MKLFQAIGDALVSAGVGRVFGLMGDANMRYIAALAEREPPIAYVSTVHEAGAVGMADAYARCTQTLGVATVTHGPGITNGLTALVEAVRSRTPMVLLTGSTPGRMPDHAQRLEIVAAADLAGAGYVRLSSAETALSELADAFKQAEVNRRPMVVDIPADLVDSEVGEWSFEVGRRARVEPGAAALDAALGVIASARRPIILVGRGAVLAGAKSSIAAMADLIGAPLATSLRARALFDEHRLNIGIFGTLSHSLAQEVIGESDCIIAVGAGLNDLQTLNRDLIDGKMLVHCDDDELNLGRFPHAITVASDARVFADRVVEALEGFEVATLAEWTSDVAKRLVDFRPELDFEDRTSPPFVDMRAAMVALNRIAPGSRAVSTDVGRFYAAPWRYLRSDAEQFVYTASFGAIGLGIAAAIGTAFANPEVLTIAVVGDGGAMMSFNELATAVEHSLRIAIVVLNDNCYGAEYTKLLDYGHAANHSLRPWPSFSALAEAYGAEGVRITSLGQIDALAPRLAALSGPLIVEIMADPAVDPSAFAGQSR